MRVMVNKTGHQCDGMFGEAEPAFVGDDLHRDFKDQVRIVFNDGGSIVSCTINKKYCMAL